MVPTSPNANFRRVQRYTRTSTARYLWVLQRWPVQFVCTYQNLAVKPKCMFVRGVAGQAEEELWNTYCRTCVFCRTSKFDSKRNSTSVFFVHSFYESFCVGQVLEFTVPPSHQTLIPAGISQEEDCRIPSPSRSTYRYVIFTAQSKSLYRLLQNAGSKINLPQGYLFHRGTTTWSC